MKFEIEDGVLKNVEVMESETSMIIPDGVRSIGHLNFFSFLNLSSVTLPDSLYDVQGLRDLLNLENWDNILVSKGSIFFTSLDGVLYNKSMTELIRCPTGKKSVNIPNSVMSIECKAFHFCKSLTSITIPNSVTRIGSSAFCGCEKLTSVTIPCDVTKIEPLTFMDCIELTSIIIPDRLASIESYAFNSCISLTSIKIGDNVERINGSALSQCDKLSSIIVSDKNISFKMLDGILYGNNVNELVKCLPNKSECFIPGSVTNIGDAAFCGCEKLTSIIIPDSVECIGESAFDTCRNLKSIILPNSLESIEERTFTHCTSLTSIVIPNSVTSIGSYAFGGCTSLISIFLPNSLTCIDDKVFSDCTNLTSIVIPNSVTSIGDSAFWNCTSLMAIFLPDSITNIEEFAFACCPNLTICAPANSYAENYAKENEINFLGKSSDMSSGDTNEYETKPANNVAKKSRSKLDLLTSSEDQLYNDFYDSFDDSDELFGGCIFMISIKSEDIASIIIERYADQCGESSLSKYDVLNSDDGIPVHLFRESGICMFEISNEGEYGGPLPESHETLTDIVKYWVKNFFRNDEDRNFEGYELDQYIESAEYLEMMNNLKCKGTYYQGRFKYSEDISDCIDPSHMRGFAFSEGYIDDYLSD
jgi:hypothetical protein